ncbi:MAG: sigma 54-interacting transcriptional regulator [candidate division KSB1 bacterium]|nr:sigma 54-interacting transcriptional regulator [candidate division KSB1 bacterium]MDZ7301686.1 sigma 54-interacting transcriptional regulator [candidate division KSB1 bacterium]MDZ7312427.1 sigma 54-interacting transcriptional regulator [candidate division KSB1 bacterium]
MIINNRVRAALQQIAAQISNAFQAQICVIALSENSRIVETLLHWGENFSSLIPQDLHESLNALSSLRQPLHISSRDHDTGEFGGFSYFLSAQGFQAFIAIPIVSNAIPCGTLCLFFTNPRDFPESEILHLAAVTNAIALALNLEAYEKPPAHDYGYSLESIITQSPAMYHVFDIMKKAALTDANVLIFGESGTGKELIARGIHNLSRRKNNAFIPVDCVALPSSLLESELFGFEKGAFTGAMGRKHGLLEFADHGTFFLDEITELDPLLQAKLLRVLQERQFRRIGGQNLISVDIRVISATNRNPEAAVKEKILREDLYFRLNVIPIYVPALRERKEDIPILATHFIDKFIQANDLGPKELAPETMSTLQEYHWPGNVRELQNVIERVISLCSGDIILPSDLALHIRHHRPLSAASIISTLQAPRSWREELKAFKELYFKNLLEQTHGHIPEAARHAKVSLRTVYRIAQKYK